MYLIMYLMRLLNMINRKINVYPCSSVMKYVEDVNRDVCIAEEFYCDRQLKMIIGIDTSGKILFVDEYERN